MDLPQASLLTILMGLWGVVTVGLLIMLIYRSQLENREEDQIFLDAAEDAMAREQRAIVSRINKLSKPITGLAIASGALLLIIAGIWIWQGLKNF